MPLCQEKNFFIITLEKYVYIILAKVSSHHFLKIYLKTYQWIFLSVSVLHS